MDSCDRVRMYFTYGDGLGVIINVFSPLKCPPSKYYLQYRPTNSNQKNKELVSIPTAFREANTI